MTMVIDEYTGTLEAIMPLLLLGDESAEMIGRYIHRARIFTCTLDTKIIAVCAVTDEPDGWLEIKNLAVCPANQRQGIGRAMLAHIHRHHTVGRFRLGTGETPSTLRFYESCGYRYSHRIPNFFTDNYPQPIIEEGIRLKDMIYLTRTPHPDMTTTDIITCTPAHYPLLVDIWEESVRATHHFLGEEDIAGIRRQLTAAYFPAVDISAIRCNGEICGFIGTAGNRIEMLFVAPQHFGHGCGSRLIAHALQKGCTAVDVNEQNPRALAFYLNKGFRVIGRDATDDCGRPFPLLHLAL